MKKLICWADKMLSKRQMRKMIGGTNDKTCTVFIPRTQTVHPNLTEEQAKFLIEASGGEAIIGVNYLYRRLYS